MSRNFKYYKKIMKYIKIKDVKSPIRANHNDSWIDFFIPNGGEYFLRAKQRITIPLWIKIMLKEWTDLQLVDKSWLASKQWLTILWWLIDEGYRWELAVVVYNTSEDATRLIGWQKIVQGVIRLINTDMPEEISEDKYSEDTSRWDWWFGSTWI